MKEGYDILIISTQNSSQEEFWQKRLRSVKGKICRPDALIITVAEQWPGGAGTGLGTLYAYAKAQEKAKFKYHQDLLQMQRDGASVALYHTAGEGKELFPLVASEHNSIANIIVPSEHGNLLETVIKQTNQRFSKAQEGRLSVFHCDQVFFPDQTFQNTPSTHIELFCQTQMVRQKGRRLIALENSGPKVFDVVDPIALATKAPVAKNLSAFTLSLEITLALLEEFKTELEEEHKKLDANRDFWMPLTLDFSTFLSLNPYPEDQMHFHRMTAFKNAFCQAHPNDTLTGVKDIGPAGYWWDFRSVRSYFDTLLKLTRSSTESDHLRLFLGLRTHINETRSNRVMIDRNSYMIDSEVRGGSIKNSVLIGVKAEALDVENCVIINCSLDSMCGKNNLLYKVREQKPLKLASGTVRADVILGDPEKEYRMYTHLDRSGNSDWNTLLPQNPLSFSEIHSLLTNVEG